MRIAQVVGQVVSTAKDQGLAACSLLLVRDWPATEANSAQRPQVAVDLIGAGIDEVVIVASGSAARIPSATAGAPTDLAIVGIVDIVSEHGTVTYDKS